jgi:hypothetical protein
VILGRRKICTFGPAKNMQFWPDEKYELWGRRKICTFGPAKNMLFWAGEKYVVLGRRKICTFVPAKNMWFWATRRKAVDLAQVEQKEGQSSGPFLLLRDAAAGPDNTQGPICSSTPRSHTPSKSCKPSCLPTRSCRECASAVPGLGFQRRGFGQLQ